MSTNNQADQQKKGDDPKRVVQLTQEPGTANIIILYIAL